jgi:hypothetical protein
MYNSFATAQLKRIMLEAEAIFGNIPRLIINL